MKVKTLIPKLEARKQAVQRKSELSPEEIRKKTNMIIERFTATDDFIRSKIIHCYISSRPGEIETRKLIDIMEGCGKTIILPKMNKISRSLQRFYFTGWDNVIKNSEGYLEPNVGIDEENNDVDLFIVPALAVSLLGQRVGYGGGYYDRLLKNTYAPKIVLALELQIFDSIENTSQDVRIDKIVTERRVINTRETFTGK